MKRLIIGGLAALAIGLAAAPVAGADANDREFIKATDQVIMGLFDGSREMRWIGYPGVPAQLRIDTAHTACSMFDTNASGQDISDMVVTAFDDRREQADYLAAWFKQSAIVHYCPRHSDEIGII